MKKTAILITLVFMVFLSACVTEIDVEDSVVSKEELDVGSYTESTDESTTSTPDNSDESDTSKISEQTDVSDETSEPDGFKVITDTASYEFYSESSTGNYHTEFHSAKSSENSITITLLDGRVMDLNYTEIVFDEKDQIYRTTINELDFKVSEFHDSANTLCQVFECIEPIENLGDFDGKVDSTITVKYKPELERGEIDMSFLYETDGDKVTIRYPDGKELTKTVKYNEETEEYYFA